MSFESLGLSTELLPALKAEGFQRPTPVQRQAIPLLLAGKDLAAQAQTGCGKTLAFVLPTLERLLMSGHAPVQALVLVPTRELALQVARVFRAMARGLPDRPVVVCMIGGEPIERHIQTLRQPVSVLVATPGRLLDLVERRAVDLRGLRTLVLDEADKLLDQGFVAQLDSLLAVLPAERQSMLFSATLPQRVLDVADKVLVEHAVLVIAPKDHAPAPDIHQRVIQVDRNKRRALLQDLIHEHEWTRTLVFVATQTASENMAYKLRSNGISAISLHGGLDQDERTEALRVFTAGQATTLVATDLAARGLDVPGIQVVVNFDLPRSPLEYVHRIGRTARAGASGQALSFVDHETLQHWRVIEKKNAFRLEPEQIPGFELSGAPPRKRKGAAPKKGKRMSKKDKLRQAAARGESES